MTTYVLIPGYWLGGWAWQSVARTLRANGHDVYPLSLTGMGERAHLASQETTLETHITDVLNLLRYEDLTDVVLVGHSYAGAVLITSAADRMPERIAKLVFVDSGPLPNGMAMSQFDPDEHAANTERVNTEGDGWQLPPPPWTELAATVPDLAPTVVKTLTEHSTPQPWATVTTPVSLTGAWESLPRLGILCEFTEEKARELAPVFPPFQHMADPQWHYEELPTWHWPMLSEPTALANILMKP